MGDVDDADHPAPRPDPAARGAVYANHFEVGFNAFEFLFDFGQQYDDSPAACAAARIVTAPAYAKVFCGLLLGSIADYESSFGPIPSPPETDPDT
jgi:hypothetical protein